MGAKVWPPKSKEPPSFSSPHKLQGCPLSAFSFRGQELLRATWTLTQLGLLGSGKICDIYAPGSPECFQIVFAPLSRAALVIGKLFDCFPALCILTGNIFFSEVKVNCPGLQRGSRLVFEEMP